MKRAVFAGLSIAFLAVAACDMRSSPGYGFRLPEGDPVKGRQVFVDKQCASCHVIAGMEELRDGVETELAVPIGGMRTRIDTYGQLVTSVINPSHRVARAYRLENEAADAVSPMRNYNDEMTVSELIDLVTFLQDQYTEFPDY